MNRQGHLYSYIGVFYSILKALPRGTPVSPSEWVWVVTDERKGMETPMDIVGRVGRRTIQTGRDVMYGAGYFFQVLKETVFFFRRRQIGFQNLVLQILYTGIQALSVAAVISLSLGAVIIVQGISLLPQFGQGDLIYAILVTVIMRELGPILTAFIIIARSATAIATELGHMVTSHEIEAYVSTGINPISYLVVPRFIGVTVSMLILNLYFNAFGLCGSYFLTQLVEPVPISEYFGNLLQAIRPTDLLASSVKSVVFGIIISVVATYNGFKVENSTTEIPQVAIRAVGQGFIYCILANAVITLIYYS